mgnify:FL=1
MKLFRKKGISALLAVLLLCALLPITAHADETGVSGDVSWSFSGSTLAITGKGAMANYTDEELPPWSSYADSITRIRVESGVTRIGDIAFYNCTNVTGVTLPDTLERIGDYAFKNCTSLGYVNFPTSLRGIGNAAFESCEKLTGIRLPEGLTSIGNYAFYRCYGLTSITIPASVSSMGMVVFAYCSGLTGAEIRCPITKIPDWTFYKCTALTAVSLPDTVTEAGEYSFHECGQLEEIYYAGSSADGLLESIRQDNTALAAGVSVKSDEAYMGASSSDIDVKPGSSTGSSSSTTVSDSGNSTITDKSQTDFTFTVDGKESTLEEINAANESGGQVGVDASSKTTISATVDNSDGWTEVSERIDDALSRGGDGKGQKPGGKSSVEANVTISGTQVKGDDLANIAGKDVTLEVTTEAGDRWRFEGSNLNGKDMAGKTYDLGYTMERDDRDELEADASYKLSFSGKKNPDGTVAVALPGDRAGQYATLFEKSAGKYDELETVLVDNGGNAWFGTTGVSSRGDYYVAVNARIADTANATIPHTMYEQYGIEPEYTLTDAEGNYYAVGERESSWGITKKQFGFYIGIGLGAVILVVAIAMISVNIVKKSRAKAAAEHAAALGGGGTDDIDEDALRLEILQEMLAERQKNREEQG